MTFFRGFASGVPRGECELWRVCRADSSGLAAKVAGRVTRHRETHDLSIEAVERDIRYLYTLSRDPLVNRKKKCGEDGC